jgi:hypothetical protein
MNSPQKVDGLYIYNANPFKAKKGVILIHRITPKVYKKKKKNSKT